MGWGGLLEVNKPRAFCHDTHSIWLYLARQVSWLKSSMLNDGVKQGAILFVGNISLSAVKCSSFWIGEMVFKAISRDEP